MTGGAGFIGSNFIRKILETRKDIHVVNLDGLTYAGVTATVREVGEDRHTFMEGDIRDADTVDKAMADVDIVVHFAAETFVDRSITQSRVFLETNVLGTDVLVRAALRNEIKLFLHISTDEVYGSLTEGSASESHPLQPSSPYAASKAGSDLLALSYHVTYGLPLIVTRCTNNYGPYQFPEKVIPLFITNLLDRRPVPLYGDGTNQRDWLYVTDHCEAILKVMEQGEVGQIYNIGAGNQVSNRELTEALLSILELPNSLITFVEDRPGHDFRYAVDSSKIRQLGWVPHVELQEGLAKTVDWYRRREDWWRPLKAQQA